MAMKKNDAIRVISLNGDKNAQWVGNVLLTAPEFSSCSARRLKAVALLVTLEQKVDLNRSWDPVINGFAMSWDSFDIVTKALMSDAITIEKFQGLVEQFGRPHQEKPMVTPGLNKLLMGFLPQR